MNRSAISFSHHRSSFPFIHKYLLHNRQGLSPGTNSKQRRIRGHGTLDEIQPFLGSRSKMLIERSDRKENKGYCSTDQVISMYSAFYLYGDHLYHWHESDNRDDYLGAFPDFVALACRIV